MSSTFSSRSPSTSATVQGRCPVAAAAVSEGCSHFSVETPLNNSNNIGHNKGPNNCTCHWCRNGGCESLSNDICGDQLHSLEDQCFVCEGAHITPQSLLALVHSSESDDELTGEYPIRDAVEAIPKRCLGTPKFCRARSVGDDQRKYFSSGHEDVFGGDDEFNTHCVMADRKSLRVGKRSILTEIDAERGYKDPLRPPFNPYQPSDSCHQSSAYLYLCAARKRLHFDHQPMPWLCGHLAQGLVTCVLHRS